MASSSLVGPAAGLMLEPAAGMAGLPLTGDGEQVEEDLRAHALSVSGTMSTHPVPGDGHCFFRSVAFQTQAGEGAHGALRAAVVRTVAADAEAYAHFLEEGNIGGWLAGMVGSQWADDLAVQACVNLLRRPVLIWRLGLEQEPALKAPWFWRPTETVTPIYLLLDETQPGCEHYNVLVQQDSFSAGRLAVVESATIAVARRRIRGKQAPPESAPVAVRRRIRGKQATPDGYPLMPPTLTAKQHHSKSLKRPAAASKPSNNKPPKAVAKPRLQQPATTNLCHGRSDAPCIFSVKNTGERARFHDKSLQCVWCNATLLEAACSTQTGKGNLSRALKFFWAHDKDIFHQACARLPAELRPCLPLKALGFPPSFSSPEHLCQTMSTPRSMGPLVASLRKKQAVDPMAVEEAIKAFPEDMQEQVKAKLAMEPNSVRKARARTEALPVEEQWKQLLQHRKRLRQPKDMKEEEKTYASRVAEDRARLQRKFFPSKPKEVKHTGRTWTNPLTEELAETIRDVAANDTGLPRADTTTAATMLEDWCKTGSWNVCANCYSLEPRHLKELDLRRVAGPCTARCRWCCKDGKASVPRVQDVPEKLRGLSVEIVDALRPFELDLGPYKRPIHGYREHTAMVRLLWSAEAVEDKIAALATGHARKKARKAYKHLMHSQQSEYKAFIKKHEEFLRHHPDDASVQQRRRPLQQIEAPGLECALWPDLYYNSDLCPTVERATDVRRLDRQGLRALGEDSSDEDGTEQSRGSVRRLFLKQVLGPILDYAGDYGLLQFVHDLAYWSDLGAKRHIQPHLSMRIMLKGAPFTPAYWAVRHAAVLDLQRQCGRPVLFKTWAPYEWSAPYHRALLHQMESLLRSRTHLATLETLHLAHILVELLREWVVGGTRKHGDSSVRWKYNVLAGAPEDGQNPRCRINFAARLE